MKIFKIIYYKIFPTFKQIELKVCSWDDADKIIREGGKSKNIDDHWHIAKEDVGMSFPFVAIERRKRITP
jgi:hypothetical protein